MIKHRRWSIKVTVTKRRRGVPASEWSLRSPEERHAIISAPFPEVRRIPSYAWAGTIVNDDMEHDRMLRREQDVNKRIAKDVRFFVNFDNVVRQMEDFA